MNPLNVEWLDPWWPIEGQDAGFREAFRRQLELEVGPGHPLFGLPTRLLARGDGDDALFEIADGSNRVAVVHLTWSKHRERPPWPRTLVLPSFAAFVEQVLRPGHQDRIKDDAMAKMLGRLNLSGHGLLVGGLGIYELYSGDLGRGPNFLLTGIILLPWIAIFTLTLCNAPPPIGPRCFRRSLLAVILAYALLLAGAETWRLYRRAIEDTPL